MILIIPWIYRAHSFPGTKGKAISVTCTLKTLSDLTEVIVQASVIRSQNE
jgi:hypothetical protein